jgi:hypothetical protein
MGIERALAGFAASFKRVLSVPGAASTIVARGSPRSRSLVAPELWGFEVSGLRVVASWRGYRMRTRKGRKSSPLDEIRPERWTPAFTEELLELLWVLEHTLAMEPELEALLDEVVRGPCFTSEELPKPSEEERRPPRRADAAAPLLEPLETDDPGEADEEPE